MLFAQALNELDDECLREFFTFTKSFLNQGHDCGRLTTRKFEESIGKFVRFISRFTGSGDGS
jgi:hypothetical protein